MSGKLLEIGGKGAHLTTSEGTGAESEDAFDQRRKSVAGDDKSFESDKNKIQNDIAQKGEAKLQRRSFTQEERTAEEHKDKLVSWSYQWGLGGTHWRNWMVDWQNKE